MMKRAEITAFLSLVFVLLVSFTGSLVDVTSLQIAKNYRRMNAEKAIECVFAEYQKELLEEYDVFALDTGYESGTFSEDLIDNRLEYYGLVNSNNLIERIKFLSDDGGEVFYQQVMAFMEHKYGIDYIKDYLDKTEGWESQEEQIKDYQQEERENTDMLEEIFAKTETEALPEDNPIVHVNGLKEASILTLVMPEGKAVSEKTLHISELPSKRELNVGYGDFPKKSYSEAEGKLLFGEYILEHFSSALDESEGVLDYEMEYVLGGKESDRENLKTVVQELLALRFVPNYTYLKSSAEKIAQAETLAVTLGTITAIPGASEALAQGILLAWAFGESVADIRTLLSGHRVPLVKNSETWQLSLSNLMKLGKEEDVCGEMDTEGGMDYEDYLKILLFLEKKEQLSMRCLDLIEQNLKIVQGLSFFRVDVCAVKMQMECTSSFRRGITYTFSLSFSYQ